MRSARSVVLVLLSVALLGSDTAFTRGYVAAHIGSTFQWSGTAQNWGGSTRAVSCSDWTTYISNDGTACTPSTVIGLTWATTHAKLNSSHSPILANNTFTYGNFNSWTSSNTGGCNGGLFSGSLSTDQDGDSGLASSSSLACTSTPAVVTLSQTFSISGTPTKQTYSFWYRGVLASAGNSICSLGYGSASLSVAINGSTQPVSSVSLDGKWHQVTGTTNALTSGSNTLTISATLQSAYGTTYNSRLQTCVHAVYSAQFISIDNISLTAWW